jgi:peptidyl-prolyl cis-trans isomerase D
MMKLLRKHRQWLMIVIAILAIPFVFYFVQKPDYGAIRSDQFARVYDRNVSMMEAQQTVRLFNLAQALGMSDFVQSLTVGAGQNQNQAYTEFILNLLVLRHEAARLGIRPGASEIADRVRDLPAFRGDAGFDMKKFTDFVQNGLSPNGLGEEHIEQLVRDELSLNQIKQLLAAGVSIPAAEIKTNYERAYDVLSVNLIRLRPADFEKDIKITDEDVQKYYEAHKAELKTEEKRKVEFISLTLSEEQKKLTGKERIEALQKLSDRANDLTQALLEKGADFKAVAAKFQLTVQQTDEFTLAAPDPKLNVDPQLGGAAFKLSQQEPNSDPIQVADGFYILHLAAVVEARPINIEEAKPKIVEAIKNSRGRELMSTKGAEVVHQLREAKKSGQPLDAAIQKSGVKIEKVSAFSLLDETPPGGEEAKKESAELTAIKNAVAYMNPGDISDFFPSEEGGLIAIVEKREASAAANNTEKKAAFENRLLNNKRQIVFYEWLRERQRAANVQFAKG